MDSLPYKLIAIDLDETLLGPDHLISTRNSEAIAKVRERGAIVCIASGRMHESTLQYAQALDLDAPIISYNGAMVKNFRTGEVWQHTPLDAEPAQKVMDFCQERNLQLNYYWNDHLYSKQMTDWLRLYLDRTGSPFQLREDFYELLNGKSPTKLIIVDTPEYTDSLIPHFRNQFGGSVYVTKTTDEYLEFMSPLAGKARALSFVAERYGIAQSEVAAFGDSYNDVEMVQWAGLGVAVGNAKPEVIAVADKVVLRSAEDGVGIALAEIFNF
jgi:Cof subfamily protein (haloacid dehalogenase superfamily)